VATVNDAVAIQVAEVLRRQTSLIRRLKTELAALKGELSSGLQGPLSDLLPIIQDETVRLSIRIEAAGLVLQHAGPEPLIRVAVAFLTTVARRGDVGSLDKVDAVKALAKRAVPKAPTPVVSAEEDRAARERGRTLEIARRRVKLMEDGKWPAPPGWDADLWDPAYVPPAVALCGPEGIAAEVRRGRLLADARLRERNGHKDNQS
jgi:hypothetical protein